MEDDAAPFAEAGKAAPPPYDSVVIEKAQAGGMEATSASPKEVDEPTDLMVRVYDPVKQGDGIGAYVSYRIETKTTLPQYQQQETEVIRRFKDFAWLRDRLAEKNPGVIVPPLPGKDVVQKFSMASEFIHKRCAALNVFVRRLSRHEVLRFSTELQFFLEASEGAWQSEIHRAGADGGAVKKTLKGAKQIFKDLKLGASNMISGKSADEEEDPEYTKVKAYVTMLEQHMGEVFSQAERLVDKQRKFTHAMTSFGEAVGKMGESEGESAALAGKLQALSADAVAICEKGDKRLEELEMAFVEPLKESAKYVRSVRDVMSGRSTALAKLHQRIASVESKRQGLAKLRATPGVKEEKLSDAEQALNESTRKRDDSQNLYDTIKERMRTEIRVFHDNRRQDLVSTLQDFSKQQAELAEEQASAWKGLVDKLAV